MKYAWITNYLEEFELKMMCQVLEIPLSSYQSWVSLNHAEREQAQQKDQKTVEDAFDQLKQNVGTRSIKGYLQNEKQLQFSRRKIGRIMAELGLVVKTKKKFKKNNVASIGDERIAPNLLNRNFEVSYPNQVWVGDITEIKTAQGKGYLAAFTDLFSRKVVGWAFAHHMRSELIEEALKRALWSRKPPKGLMIHTDQGSQFISNDFRKLLKSWHLKQSMSRRGNCWDNAVIESFFKTLKIEKIYQLPKQLKLKETLWVIREYIGYYNHQRPHSQNNYIAPEKFERSRKELAQAKEKSLGTKKC